jgi:hypothetical protein
MRATYARISDLNVARKTDFLDLKDAPGNTGKQTVNGSSPTDVILLRGTSENGRSTHFFVHGFPAKLLHEDVVVFDGKWGDLLAAWGDYMGSKDSPWAFLSASGNTVPNRVHIEAASPQSPRGFLITTVAAPTVAIGDTLAVGGASKDSVGFNGRKQVLNVSIANKTILVGGAKPVGDVGSNAYFTPLTYGLAGFKHIRPVKLTERKVGRPFGLPVGRRSATLSLRR